MLRSLLRSVPGAGLVLAITAIAAASTSSSPARACGPTQVLDPLFVPFDFFVSVPRNLDFGLVRANGADCGHPIDGRLVGPNDVEHHVTWTFSSDGTAVETDVPVEGLVPGNWQLFFSGGCAFVEDPDADNNGDGFPDGIHEARVGNFTVVDRVDGPVDGPVRAKRIDRVGGEAPGTQNMCGYPAPLADDVHHRRHRRSRHRPRRRAGDRRRAVPRD